MKTDSKKINYAHYLQGIFLFALMLFSIFFVIVMADSTTAAGGGCWTCETTARGGCKSTCDFSQCTIFECFETPLCTPNDCSGANATIDVTPPTIIINSPAEGEVSGNGAIDLDVDVDEPAASIYYSLDGRRYSLLCTSCQHGSRSLRNLGDDVYDLEVKATDYAGNVNRNFRRFIVDRKPPVIDGFAPRDGGYLAGSSGEDFTLFYDENNVEDLILHYRASSSSGFTDQSFTGCPGGRDVSCTNQVNLASYPQGTTIEYYFTLADAIATTTTDPAYATINASYLAEPIKIFSPINNRIYGAGRMDLEVELVGQVDELWQILDGGRAKRLCTNCDSYDRIQSYRDGIHDLIVYTIDGIHRVNRSIIFEVDSKAPRISKTFPKKNAYANGLFSIDYQETQLQSIILTYGNTMTGYQTDTKSPPDCAAGTRGSCEFVEDLGPYDGQQIDYHFTVNDRVHSVSSADVSVLVDYSSPVFVDVASPVEGAV
ncbi:MAG: hypothetical protein GXP63_03300, partial [DPANN group archaeon]|nr:hypothetical protein [DPANN group archaeon]